MANETIPKPYDLANKPLVEAIFEVRWELKPAGPLASDPGFPLFQGRYYDRIKEDYPFALQLPASAVPENMTAHTVRHQFRRGEKEWPVTQIGPGILTVNQTSDYCWKMFLPQLQKAIAALYEAYPTEQSPLKPIQASLRYINVLDFDSDTTKVPVLKFLKDSLHTTIIPEPLLFDDNSEPDAPKGLSLNLAYQVEAKNAIGSITLALGQANDKPALIFEIHIHTIPSSVPQNPADFTTWVTGAHDIVDKWFFALVRGDLLKTFEDSDAN